MNYHGQKNESMAHRNELMVYDNQLDTMDSDLLQKTDCLINIVLEVQETSQLEFVPSSKILAINVTFNMNVVELLHVGGMTLKVYKEFDNLIFKLTQEIKQICLIINLEQEHNLWRIQIYYALLSTMIRLQKCDQME